MRFHKLATFSTNNSHRRRRVFDTSMCVLQGDLTLRWRRFFRGGISGGPRGEGTFAYQLKCKCQANAAEGAEGRLGAWLSSSCCCIGDLHIYTRILRSFFSFPFLSAQVDFSSVLNKSRFSPTGFVRVRQAA